MNTQQAERNENVYILKQALRTAEESNNSAINTNLVLHEQGQKMIEINQKLNKINQTLDRSEDTAKEITSFWYYLKNKVKRVLGIKKDKDYKEEKEETTAAYHEEFVQGKENQNRLLDRIKEDQGQEDQLTDELIRKIREMKGHGKNMGEQLDRQNHLLGKANGKMDQACTKTEKVNKILKKELS